MKNAGEKALYVLGIFILGVYIWKHPGESVDLVKTGITQIVAFAEAL